MEGRLRCAVQVYKEKKISLGLAARIAGLPLGEFIDVLREQNLTLNLELEDVEEAVKHAEKILK